MNFIAIAGLIGIGAISLAGCSSASGTVGAFGGADTTGAPASGGLSTKAVSGGWVLSVPDSVFGFARIQPSTAVLDKIKGDLAKSTAPLGVSGTQVIAVYNDTTHGLFLVFAGYNGSGFDPARMRAAYQTTPVTTEDGTGARVVINNLTIDPGPHGGTAGCTSAMEQTAIATTEATLCSWMTTTTLGSISTFPNPDHPNVTAVGPDVMGKVKRDLRDQVEHRS
jgi:hypothetical protein